MRGKTDMTCDVATHRLLALPDPRQLPDDVRAHLVSCAACQGRSVALVRIEELIPRIPVPAASESVKQAFLDKIEAETPVIRTMPVLPRRDSGFQWQKALAGRWQTAATLATGVLLTFGVWWTASSPRTTVVAEAAPPRYDGLSKEVRSLVALTRAESPTQRLTAWTGAEADLRQELRTVYRVAAEDDLRALARRYERVIDDGIVRQATQLPEHLPPTERQSLVGTAAGQLTEAETEARRLAASAPPPTQKQLQRIADLARDGRLKLLAPRKGASS